MKYLIMLIMIPAAFAKWETESELSTLQTGGNTNVEAYNFKTRSAYEVGKRTYSLGGHYTLGTAENENEEEVVNARNWDAFVKYEQTMSQNLSGVFTVKYEGDEFSGFNQRDNYDLGGKYQINKTDKVKSFFEFGYRYTIERTVARNDEGEDNFKDNKARAYYEIVKSPREGLKIKFWTEYIYNFNRTEDYLINFEPSLALAIDKTFSLKVAYKGMYDNDPAIEGNEYLDWQYTTSLIANY